MKKLSHLFLLILLITSIVVAARAADSYVVIHLKGSITNKTTKKPLKVGDQIKSDDQLQFENKDAVVVVIGPQGKYTLSPSIKAGSNQSEMVAYVNSAIIPLKSNGHLSTRGSESEAVVDLKNYFGTSKFIIIGNKLSIKLDPSRYPLSDKQVMVYRYTIKQGQKDTAISKKIESKGNVITIDKTALYTVNGKLIDPEKTSGVEIYHFQTDTKKSTKVASFVPQFINEESLKEELKVQRKFLKEQNQTEEQIKKELLAFVHDVYGRTDEHNLNEWVNSNANAE